MRESCTKVDVYDYPLYGYVDHVEGNWFDNCQGYTSIGVFKGFPQLGFCKIIPFFDGRLHFFNNDKKAANVGVGLRRITHGSPNVIGANAYYDYRKTSFAHFNQLGVGFEFLTPCCDIRINGYLLGRKAKHSKQEFDDFTGDFFETCREKQLDLSGVDFEIGRWLRRCGSCNCLDFYGAIGAHYYDKRRYGPEVRLVTYFARYLYLEIKAGYDRHHGGMAQGVINFSIPFFGYPSCSGKGCESSCNNYCCVEDLYQPVYRQEIINVGSKECCWTWNWDSPSQACSCKSSNSKN